MSTHKHTQGCSTNGVPYFGKRFLFMGSYERDHMSGQSTEEHGTIASNYECCWLHVKIQQNIVTCSKLSFNQARLCIENCGTHFEKLS
jgi:hypothetical protein